MLSGPMRVLWLPLGFPHAGHKDCRAISLIKGLEFENGKPKLISSIISGALKDMDCSVLMGANVSARRLLIPIHQEPLRPPLLCRCPILLVLCVSSG